MALYLERILMVAQILPKFPSTYASLGRVSVSCKDDTVVYFIDLAPFFTHLSSDMNSFHLACCLLYFNRHATQVEIAELFGVSVRGIKRACKRYKESGAGFFSQKSTPKRRGPTIFTDEFIEIAQESFNNGMSKKEVAEKYELKMDTLNRAIREGRLKVKKKL